MGMKVYIYSNGTRWKMGGSADRTVRMDELAEKGYAAHWKYKDSGNESQLDD